LRKAGIRNRTTAIDYIGRFFDFFVVGVAGSVGVCVVIVESGVVVVGLAIGSAGSAAGVAGVVVVGAGVPGVVDGVAGTVLVGAPGAGVVVCANAAVERVKAAIPVKVAIRIGSGPLNQRPPNGSKLTTRRRSIGRSFYRAETTTGLF
jgi:hypothetical protein